MSTKHTIRTEHSGGKNGGGYYGKRRDAKRVSSKLRRSRDKTIVRNAR
jgi:hypothetical protein